MIPYSKPKFLLIMSSPEELRPFLRSTPHRRASWGGRRIWNFRGPNYTGVAFLAGMGGAAPPRLAGRAITDFSPDIAILAGFGGAITPLPPAGGILLAKACFALTSTRGLLQPVTFSPAAPPEALASLLRAHGLATFAGTLITTPGMTAKDSLPAPVYHLPHPVLDLETADVAAVAQAHRLPFLAVRAVTDGAGEEIQDFLAAIINQYQGVPLSRLLPALAADPRRLGHCLHLWRRSRLAGANLARALHLILSQLTHPRVFDLSPQSLSLSFPRSVPMPSCLKTAHPPIAA